MLPLIIGGAAFGGAVLSQTGRLVFNAARKRRDNTKPAREARQAVRVSAAEEVFEVAIDAAVDVLDIAYARDREVAMLTPGTAEKWRREVAKRVVKAQKKAPQKKAELRSTGVRLEGSFQDLKDAHTFELFQRLNSVGVSPSGASGAMMEDVIAVAKGKASQEVLDRWAAFEAHVFAELEAPRKAQRDAVRAARKPLDEAPRKVALCTELEALGMHAFIAYGLNPDATLRTLQDMAPPGPLGRAQLRVLAYLTRQAKEGPHEDGGESDFAATLTCHPQWADELARSLLTIKEPETVSPPPRPERDPLRIAIAARIADLEEFLSESATAPEAFRKNARKELAQLRRALDTGEKLPAALQIKLQLNHINQEKTACP